MDAPEVVSMDQITYELCFFYRRTLIRQFYLAVVKTSEMEQLKKIYSSMLDPYVSSCLPHSSDRRVRCLSLKEFFSWTPFAIYDQILKIFARSSSECITFSEFVTLCLYMVMTNKQTILQFVFYVNQCIEMSHNNFMILLSKLNINGAPAKLLGSHIATRYDCEAFLQLFKAKSSLFRPFFRSLEVIEKRTLSSRGWNSVRYRNTRFPESQMSHPIFTTARRPPVCIRFLKRLCCIPQKELVYESPEFPKFTPTPLVDLVLKDQPKMLPQFSSKYASHCSETRMRSLCNSISESDTEGGVCGNGSSLTGRHSPRSCVHRSILLQQEGKRNKVYRELCSLAPLLIPLNPNRSQLGLQQQQQQQSFNSRQPSITGVPEPQEDALAPRIL